MSLMSPTLVGRFFTTSATWKPYTDKETEIQKVLVPGQVTSE